MLFTNVDHPCLQYYSPSTDNYVLVHDEYIYFNLMSLCFIKKNIKYWTQYIKRLSWQVFILSPKYTPVYIVPLKNICREMPFIS